MAREKTNWDEYTCSKAVKQENKKEIKDWAYINYMSSQPVTDGKEICDFLNDLD